MGHPAERGMSHTLLESKLSDTIESGVLLSSDTSDKLINDHDHHDHHHHGDER